MSDTARQAFGHDTTTTEVLEGIDLTGKVALITGGSGGLGAETARALASKGAQVIITARDMEKGAKMVQAIQDSTGNPAVSVEALELGSLASIRVFAEAFLAKYDALQILINNAGVMACPFTKTSDGFEMQFGANHLGHFLLTGLLAPALINGAPARIANLSSSGHRFSPMVFEDIQFEQRDYDKWQSYGQAKTANILHAVELERRLGGKGVHAYALHPGAIWTDLTRHLEQADFDMFQEFVDSGLVKFKSVEAGSATSAYVASAPELEGRGGMYLEDCAIASVNNNEDDFFGVRSYALDPEAAQQLWAVSEELTGTRFTL